MADAITLADLASAASDTSGVAAARADLSTFLEGVHPGLVTSAGPAADLLMGPAATALAAQRVVSAAVAASANPATALAAGVSPSALTDSLAALGVTAAVAAPATGTVKLIVPTNTPPFTVSTSVRFVTATGVEFRTQASVKFVRPTDDPTSGTRLTVTTYGWVGSLSVTAKSTGTAGNIAAGTGLVISGLGVSSATAEASSTFSGGRSDETSAELLARLPAPGQARTAATASGIRTLISEAVPGSTVTVVGYGHASAYRGRLGVGIKAPGRVDARVRKTGGLEYKTVTLTATYNGTYTGITQWTAYTATSDVEAPAFVHRVWKAGTVPSVSNAFSITNRYRGYDSTKVPSGADVKDYRDAAFTVAGTVGVQFLDPTTPSGGLTAGVSQKQFAVTVAYYPAVPLGQTAVSGDAAPASGDCLVMGPTPVVVSVSAGIIVAPGSTVDLAAVKAAIASAINSTGIRRILTVAAATSGVGGATYSVSTASLSGAVYRPDDVVQSLSASATLDPGLTAASGVGDLCTAFFCDTENVTVTVV